MFLVIIYYIKTHTERSGAFSGRPFITITGDFGDTGQRFLVRSVTRTKKFKPGSVSLSQNLFRKPSLGTKITSFF